MKIIHAGNYEPWYNDKYVKCETGKIHHRLDREGRGWCNYMSSFTMNGCILSIMRGITSILVDKVFRIMIFVHLQKTNRIGKFSFSFILKKKKIVVL